MTRPRPLRTGTGTAVRTIEYLTDPSLLGLFWPGITAALLIALMSGPLSVLVVLRRMAFIGQGISHAAFGGVGLALLLGLGATAAGTLAIDGVTLAFSLLAGGLIAWLSARTSTQVDTAIGVVLAVCMAAGFVMHGVAATRAHDAGLPALPSLESILFGMIHPRLWIDAAVALVATVLVMGTLAVLRRGLVFWAFDEPVSIVHGVRAGRMHGVALVLVTLAVIVTMKLAGIVLASALLVLPGAAALRLGLRLSATLLAATLISVLGAAAGLVLSFESGLPPGPCVVGVLALAYAAALAIGPRRWTATPEVS